MKAERCWMMVLVLGCSLVMIPSLSAWADVLCGDQSCTENELCAETEEGSECLSLCRRHEDCESDCCQSIEEPTTAWVCQDAEACVVDDSGDDQSNVGEEKCGTTLCDADELCMTYGQNSFCTQRCNVDSDCARPCCRAGDDQRRGCVPEGFSCPSENSEDDGIPLNSVSEGCQGVPSFPAGLAALVFVVGLFAFRRRGLGVR